MKNNNSNKSHVSMEQKVCPCCDKVFDSGSILLDTRLKDSLDRNTVTGFKLCDECHKEGYVLLVEINNVDESGTIKASDANRTGRSIYVINDIYLQMFKQSELRPMVYIGKEIFDDILRLHNEINNDAD